MIKLFTIISLLFTVTLFAETPSKKEELKKKHIKKQIEREKKYSVEQTFYKGKNYDLKGAEVDEKSVESIPENRRDNDDFDMDAVYD